MSNMTPSFKPTLQNLHIKSASSLVHIYLYYFLPCSHFALPWCKNRARYQKSEEYVLISALFNVYTLPYIFADVLFSVG